MKHLFLLIGTLSCYSLCASSHITEVVYEESDGCAYEEKDQAIADNSEESEEENNNAEEEESEDSTPASEESATQVSFEQGDAPLEESSLAYNPPAQILLDQPYQAFATVSYLYWNAQQDGMDVATSGTYIAPNIVKTGVRGKTFNQEMGYNSGFKLGFGYNFKNWDDWTLRADLTSLNQTTTSSFSAPSSTTGIGALYLTNWFYQASTSNQNPACKYLKSTWHLGFNWLDIAVSRALYQGERFTISPFGGVRTSWISQSLKLKIRDVLNFSSVPLDETPSKNTLSSWGIGPRLGLDGRFLLGMGFRLQGNIGASLLFTKYTQLSHYEKTLTLGQPTLKYRMNNYTCLRPMFETNLGFGWGMYLSKNRYHIDLSATYDFNYLWNQNMMRTLNEINIIGNSGSGLDLSLQGLTLSAYFHF